MEKWDWFSNFSPYGYLIQRSFHKRQRNSTIKLVTWVSSYHKNTALCKTTHQQNLPLKSRFSGTRKTQKHKEKKQEAMGLQWITKCRVMALTHKKKIKGLHRNRAIAHALLALYLEFRLIPTELYTVLDGSGVSVVIRCALLSSFISSCLKTDAKRK